MVYKGIHSDIESYSSFFDNSKRAETQMRNVLQTKNITDVFVCGLALDVCVGELKGCQSRVADACSWSIHTKKNFTGFRGFTFLQFLPWLRKLFPNQGKYRKRM